MGRDKKLAESMPVGKKGHWKGPIARRQISTDGGGSSERRALDLRFHHERHAAAVFTRAASHFRELSAKHRPNDIGHLSVQDDLTSR